MSGIKKKKIVLREERTTGDCRFLGAEIKGNGDLVFEGQDVGSGVEGVFGFREYEWYWTVRELDIPKLKNAIGREGDILELLKEQFSDENAAGLFEFMKENNVPFESWSRTGD